METKTTGRYTLDDVGCYVDGARGIYAVDRIVEIAEGHDMEPPDPCFGTECPRCAWGDKTGGDGAYSEWANCDESSEVEDEATEYMNAQHAVDGAWWGRSESGDWGLWPSNSD